MNNDYDVIVIGGGIIGASIAYHLASSSPARSVCLLERSKLTSGTTWHAAGLVAELRASANLTRLARYSGELYERLQGNGEPLGFRRVGALTLAKHPARRFELQKQAAMARNNGVDCHWWEAGAIAERWPHLWTEDLCGGIYLPRDGQTNPVDTTLALARLARAHGADIREDTPVSEILVVDGSARGVRCDDVEIRSEQVVLCAGLWSRQLGATMGVDLPLYPAEHFYAVTEALTLPSDAPIVRVPDDGVYLKPDAGRLLIGCFERQAKPLDPARLPVDFSFDELPFDLEHFAPYLERGLQRIPAATDCGIRTWFNGPESFTPDGRYLLGETPTVEQLFVAAGFNSIGIQSAGGVGRVMADWLLQRRPPMDLWEVDVRRFESFHNQQTFLVERTAESLGLLYAMHWPYYQHTSARDQKRSPIHDELAQTGACFGEVAGWERPNWYARAGQPRRYEYSYERQNWFENARREHHAVRHEVALFDQTSFAKYAVTGREACAFLNRLCTANVDMPVGQLRYCQWLNPTGGIEADVTVTRLAQTAYRVISGAACVTRDLHWLRRHAPDFEVEITDVTREYAVFGIMGPLAREWLQPLTDQSLHNEDFAFGTAQYIDIRGHRVYAQRITYVGELGWELYVPWQAAAAVYRHLSQARIQHAGYHAMDSLRIEKAYRHWGHDITDEDTPVEAGLSFTADFHKAGGFIGDQRLLQQRNAGVQRRLALFRLADPECLLTHDEPIWRNGEAVGQVVSSAYSYTFDATLAFGYISGEPTISRAEVLAGTYEIEVAARKVAATVSLRAWYDPDNQRIHA